MTEYLPYSSDEASEEEIQRRPPKRPFKICDKPQPKEFQRRFRLSPRQFELLLQELGPSLAPTTHSNNALTAPQKLLIALRFFASNDWYYEISDFHGNLRIVYRHFIHLLRAF